MVLKKNTLLLLGAMMIALFTSSVSAEYRVYTDMGEFEKAKGAVCEAATDGCNNYFMTDGKVMGGTRMFCENHKVEWTCTKFKEGVMTTMMLPETTTLDEVRTTTEDILSENDRNFYNTIKNRLDDKYQDRVEKVVTSYEKKLARYPDHRKARVNKALIKKVDSTISKFLLRFPADTALSEKNNNIYLMLSLLKFELEYLGY